MDKFPLLRINREKLRNNLDRAIALCDNHKMELVGVTKAVSSEQEIVELFIDQGVNLIADSRIDNLRKIKDLDCLKMLLRVPSFSDLSEVVRYADLSVHTEIETLRRLNQCAEDVGIKHKVILFIELGDLREGFIIDELKRGFPEILGLNNICVSGIGVNLTCYGGVLPDRENMTELIEFANLIEQDYNFKIKIISSGNSSIISALLNNELPGKLNQVRLGESIFLGRETAHGDLVKGFFDDVFIVEAKIVELKQKPSFPKGNIGLNAFGEKPNFVDKGMRKRAIVAIGRKDIDDKSLFPLDTEIEIIGASSDYLIVDVSDSKVYYSLGDTLKFKVGYSSLIRVFENINKVYL